MSSSLPESHAGAESAHKTNPLKRFINDLMQIGIDAGHILKHIISCEQSLAERISRYGKIRFLIVCDENMGRSPLFLIALKKHITELGFDNSVEVLSAGTDVVEKGSRYKYGGGTHPVVKAVMGNIPGVDPESHQLTQFDETLVTPNTILVSLNDPNKISKKIRRKCIATLDFSMNDPHDVGEGTLHQRLTFLYMREYYLAMYLGTLVQQSFENDDLLLFKLCESIHV